MTALSTPPVAIDPLAARVVLFGMPDAGKSSLLGALAQASHTQGRALRGHLTDLSHGLGDLRRRLYDERPRETQQEIVPYPIRFDPLGEPSTNVVLYDCDGRVANDLLAQKRNVDQDARPDSLANTVLNADALILTVDASATREQIDGDFREFLKFLRLLETHRAREYAVGGFPVFLVLTKCDVLADERETRAQWDAAIEARRREVEQRFKDFLEAEAPGEFLSFGSLSVDVSATAVRRPTLADALGQPREPFGVAELFRAAILSAVRFRDRQKQSSRRLMATVGGVGAFLGSLAIMAGLFLSVTPAPEQSTLTARVETIQANEPQAPATRLGPGLEKRLKELSQVLKHPDFEQLPGALQNFVKHRLEEGEAYIKFRDSVATIPAPKTARSLGELKQIEVQLTSASPPAAYIGEWSTTEASKARDKLLKEELPGIRQAVGQLTQHYYGLKNRAANLVGGAADLSAAWSDSVKALNEDGEKPPPFPRTDPSRGGAFAYDEVGLAESEWQTAKQKLAQVYDMAAVFGLIGNPTAPTAPLALTELPMGADVLGEASRRWKLLKKHYPEHTRWVVADLPDGVRIDVERALKKSNEQAIRDGQRVVLERFVSINPALAETPGDWPRLADYLLSPALEEWRELGTVLARLQDPKAEGPAPYTAAFLKKSSFDLQPKKVRVRVPDTLSDAIVRPNGDLKLVVKRATGEATTLLMKPATEVRDKQSMLYTFIGDGSLTYRPGDTFHAELPVRKGERDLKLTWASSRTQTFQFERLLLSPRLHAADQSNIEGTVAEGVSASVLEGVFPMVPGMVPIIRAR